MQKNKSNIKILICGGAGYVGGFLTDLLKYNKYNVTVYDNLVYESRFMKNIPFIFGDIRDKEKLSKIEDIRFEEGLKAERERTLKEIIDILYETLTLDLAGYRERGELTKYLKSKLK